MNFSVECKVTSMSHPVKCSGCMSTILRNCLHFYVFEKSGPYDCEHHVHFKCKPYIMSLLKSNLDDIENDI